ncbi:MAG TPA: hypothetical protein PKV16_04630 [Caldisericia bacterium]|nr:hypothetical protein [Caldisericia bacterium]HPF48596.1 hypothetical protein [Caldisericia bacterium]HPI83744.1 hypothetical protein [Caldisericia bacterium]HPQ93051.1 hypothetical protein [Caldisericia bacterium]HRV75116.1 hypothetical protein [Caldisericia bacterium]
MYSLFIHKDEEKKIDRFTFLLEGEVLSPSPPEEERGRGEEVF